MANLPAHIRLSGELVKLPVAEAGDAADCWRVVILREGWSLNRSAKGLPIYYGSEGFAEAAALLEGAPVHAKDLALDRDHEDRDPNSAPVRTQQVRKTPNGTRIGYLREVAVEAIDGVQALVGRLRIVPRAKWAADELARRAAAAAKLPELSINALAKATVAVVEAVKAHRVYGFERFASVDVVGRGAAGGAILAAAESADDLTDALYAALVRCAGAYVAGVDANALDEADLIDRLRQAVDENLGTTLDAAGVADQTGQRVREVYELRQAYQSIQGGRREEAWRCLASIVSDAFAPGGYGLPYGYGESAPTDPPEALPIAAAADPQSTPAPSNAADPASPASRDKEPAMAEPITTPVAESAHTEALAEAAAAARETNKMLVDTMLERADLEEPLREALSESLYERIDAGKAVKRPDIQAAIDKQLKVQERMRGNGSPKAPNGVDAGIGKDRMAVIESCTSGAELVHLGIARGLGADARDHVKGATHADDWPAGTRRIGLAEGYKIHNGAPIGEQRRRRDIPSALRELQELDSDEREALAETAPQILTTSDWPKSTADVLQKKGVREYKSMAIPELQVTTRADGVDSLQPIHWVRTGGFADLPIRTQGSDYAETTEPSEEGTSYSLADHGVQFSITFEMVHMNQTSNVAGIPRRLAIAAAKGLRQGLADAITGRTSAINDTAIYTGQVPYRTANANYNASAPLNVTNFNTAFAAMQEQEEADSERPEIVEPGFLYVGPRLRAMALQILNSTDDPSTADRATNPNRNIVQPIVSAFVGSSTAWFLIANPAMGGETIEVAYFMDQAAPQILVADAPTNGLLIGSHMKITYVCNWWWALSGIKDYRSFYGGGF